MSQGSQRSTNRLLLPLDIGCPKVLEQRTIFVFFSSSFVAILVVVFFVSMPAPSTKWLSTLH